MATSLSSAKFSKPLNIKYNNKEKLWCSTNSKQEAQVTWRSEKHFKGLRNFLFEIKCYSCYFSRQLDDPLLIKAYFYKIIILMLLTSQKILSYDDCTCHWFLVFLFLVKMIFFRITHSNEVTFIYLMSFNQFLLWKYSDLIIVSNLNGIYSYAVQSF